MNIKTRLKKCISVISTTGVYGILIYFTLFCFLISCFISFYNAGLSKAFVNHFAIIPLFLVLIIGIINKHIFSKKLYIFCLCFLGWILITYFIKGDGIYDTNNLYVFINRCAFCIIAIPFAKVLCDTKTRKYLDIFLLTTIIAVAILLWLCYLATLTGENITLFNTFEFGKTCTYTGRIKLKVLNLHYYHLGYLSLICFFSCLYLTVSHWAKQLITLWLFLLGTFGVGVIFTYSRTAIFTFIGGLLIAFYVLLSNIKMKHSTRIIILVSVLVSAIFMTILGLNFIYKFMHSIRDIWYGITTLSSRTIIWQATIDIFIKYPTALISGFPLADITELINHHLPNLDHVDHMHSGYLQTLLSIGLPGFIAVVAYAFYVTKNSIQIIFTTKNISFTNAEKIMTIVPITCLVIGLFESIIFYNSARPEIFNLFTALFSGYVICIKEGRK